MKKPTGGRGHKAKYESTHARIPEPIKPLVESLSDQYRSYVAEGDCLEFENRSLLPKVPAIYFVLEDEEIIYIGQTKDLCHRWQSHHLLKEFQESPILLSIAWLHCENVKLLRPIETSLIEALKPRFNISIRGETSTSYTPTWKHGKTRTIRVPIELADEGLKLIRALDEGHSVSVTQAKDEEIRQLREKLAELIILCLEMRRELDSGKVDQGAIFKLMDEFIESLQGTSKGNQYGKELKPKARTWDKFNQFKDWVKAKINQVEKGD